MNKDANFSMPKVLAERKDQKLAKPKLVEKLGKRKIFSDANYPYEDKMNRDEYESLKKELQIEMLKMQGWVKETGQRVVILFEGRDAAGKGAPSSA